MAKKLKRKQPQLKSQSKHRKSLSAKCSPRRCNYPQEQILGIGPKMINSILIGIHENDVIHVRKILDGLDEYEVANLLESLSIGDRQKLIEMVGAYLEPEVLPELNEVVQEQVIESLDEEQIIHIVNELDSDDAVELLEHMNDEEQEQVISHLSPELKQQVTSSLSYPDDSAGRVMSRDFVAIPDDWTVTQAKQYFLKEKELPDEFYTIFLTDNQYRPTGAIPLDKLLRAKGTEKLDNIKDGEIVPVNVYTDQEEVAHMFREYGWMSAVVVDANQRMIGVINIDDVVHIIHEEASEDIMLLSGAEEGDVYKSSFAIFRSRIIWQITNLLATLIASYVVSGFEDIISQVAALAVLMPIVASMGGTAGSQTLAVVIRALATKELTSRNTLRMIGKEFAVGLMNGFLFAGTIAVITWYRFPEYHNLSMVIALAMLCNLVIASLSGILIPLFLNKCKIDPAISSAVFLIALTDSGGFFIFLGLAKLLLF